MRPYRFTALVVMLLLAGPSAGQALDPKLLLEPPTRTWPTYNGDYSGRRYSSLAQIKASNIGSLAMAWMFTAPASPQSLPNLPLTRLGYTVKKRTVNPQGELKDKIDAVDRELAEATKQGNVGQGEIQVGRRIIDVNRLRAPVGPEFDRRFGRRGRSVRRPLHSAERSARRFAPRHPAGVAIP